jgi:hypothetical protein
MWTMRELAAGHDAAAELNGVTDLWHRTSLVVRRERGRPPGSLDCRTMRNGVGKRPEKRRKG